VRSSRRVGAAGRTVEKVADPKAPRNAHLTPRQVQVLKLLAEGRTTADLVDTLHLPRETVRNHIRHVLNALAVHSRVQPVARARDLGIL
jgi:DNA-binding NarL/FixJ family response regulator